jgi:hypothetical protein
MTVRVVASLLSYPPHRFIGSELMTHSLLKRLQARGHEVTVVVREGDAPWSWEGITVTGGSLPRGEWHTLPDGDVLVYHAEYFVGSVEEWVGPKVAICHNSRIGVEMGLYNCAPELATLNSETMRKQLRYSRSMVVHPPVFVPAEAVHGSRVTVINMEETSKVGPFWELVKLMPDVDFLGVKGGYGKQAVPRGRRPRNVKVIDQVPPSEMAEKVWAETAVLMVPSASESWSMVASEAMSHGIPVIANPLPGLIENLDGAGMWALRDQPWSWVQGIRKILSAWDEFSAVALERAQLQAQRHEAEAEAWCDAVEALCRR